MNSRLSGRYSLEGEVLELNELMLLLGYDGYVQMSKAPSRRFCSGVIVLFELRFSDICDIWRVGQSLAVAAWIEFLS